MTSSVLPGISIRIAGNFVDIRTVCRRNINLDRNQIARYKKKLLGNEQTRIEDILQQIFSLAKRRLSFVYYQDEVSVEFLCCVNTALEGETE